MRKPIILFLLLALCGINASSQSLTATLQHDNGIKVFYGYQSFIEAYEDAQDGDVITLSKGNFNTVGCIEKSVSVIGNYAFDQNEESTSLISLEVSADDVTLCGLRILGTLRMSLSNDLKVKRCFIESLAADTTHTRTLIEDCAVQNDFSLARGIEESYRRSEIYRQHNGNTPDNMANFEYCTIHNVALEEINVHYVRGVKHYDNQLASYGIYRNCAIHWSRMVTGQSTAQAALHLNRQSDYRDLMLFGGLYGNVSYVVPDGTLAMYIEGRFIDSDNYSVINDSFPSFFEEEIVIPQSGGWEYKAPVGCFGHKPYPSIPRVVECNIDRETDAAGKLKIDLKVVVED